MLVICIMFALVTIGFVVPCLIDVALTPDYEIVTLSKRTWMLLILLLSVAGCGAWLLAGRPARHLRMRPLPRHLTGSGSLSQQEALRRHPAGRAMEPTFGALTAAVTGAGLRPPIGPDDDPEFLLELERRIQGWPDSPGES